jgi:hypothetical protein
VLLDSPKDKLSCCDIALQKLQLLNNKMAQWRDNGITEIAYNKLPLKIRSMCSYKTRITDGEFRNIQELIERNQNAVIEKLHIARREQREMEPEHVVDIDRDII